MRFIRIKNDVRIKWTIMRNYDAEDFTDKDITVKLISKCGCSQPITYSISDNNIFIDYFGKDQVETGVYRLELIENDGKPNMATLDFVDAFSLSKTLKNKTSNGSDSLSSLETEVVDIESTLNTTGVEYVGGEGIDVIGSVISVDDTIATKESVDLVRDNLSNEIAVRLASENNIYNALDTKQHKLTAGANIDITDDTISVKDVLTVTNKFGEDVNMVLTDENEGLYFGTTFEDGHTESSFKIINGEPYVGKAKIKTVFNNFESSINGLNSNMANKADKSEIPDISNLATKDELYDDTAIRQEIANKADKSEIPTIPNFKTINGETITGDGDITITGGTGGVAETYNKTYRISAVNTSTILGRTPGLVEKNGNTLLDDVWYVTDNGTEGLPMTEGWQKDGFIKQLHTPTFTNSCTFIWMNLYDKYNGAMWVRNVRNSEVFDWLRIAFKENNEDYISFNNDRCIDANEWLTNGYIRTNGEETQNLPEDCTDSDKWGVLFTIMENSDYKTGTQMYYPVNGTNKGHIYTRSFAFRQFEPWRCITKFCTINGNSILGEGDITITGTGGTADLPDNLVTGVEKPYKIWNGSKEEYDAITEKEQDTIYIVDGDELPTGTGLEDAPNDGNKYGRQNGQWVTISEGGGQGGGNVYSTNDNTFTGQNVFNNTVEFNNNLYTPYYGNISFRDNSNNNWTWNEFVRDGKDINYGSSSSTSYSTYYSNKKIEWNDIENRYVANDVEGYTVVEYNIIDTTYSIVLYNSGNYSYVEYFTGSDIDSIVSAGITEGYYKVFINFITSEISLPGRYAFEQVNQIPVDGDYNSSQVVPEGYKAYKSTGHGNSIDEYMNITFGGTQSIKYYNSSETGCDYVIINDFNTTGDNYNYWHDFTDELNASIQIKWHKDGSVDSNADACWIMIPEDANIDIEYITGALGVNDITYEYNVNNHDFPKLQKHLEFNSDDFNINNQGEYDIISLKNSGGSSSGGGWTSEAESSLHMNNYGVYSAEGYFTDYAPGNDMRFHHGFVPGGGSSRAPGSGIWYNGLGLPYGQANIIETAYDGRDIFHFYECSGHFIFHKYLSGGDDIKLAEITNLGIKEGPDFLKDKYALKTEITPTTPNIVKFGDVIIENGIMHNFSNANYAQFPFLMDLTDKAFEITMKITTGDNVTNQQNILDSRDGLAFAIRNSQFILAVSNNGTSWAFEAVGQTAISANSTYLVKLSWDKLVYKVEFTDDNGVNWYTTINQAYEGHPYPRTMLIGKDTTGNYVFTGQIYLNKCTLAVNGQYVWDGMADAGLLTRLETDLGNIDSNGEAKIKEIVAQDTITLTATLEDGTVKTFEIYGKEV